MNKSNPSSGDKQNMKKDIRTMSCSTEAEEVFKRIGFSYHEIYQDLGLKLTSLECIFNNIVLKLKKMLKETNTPSVYDSYKVPKISLEEYLMRVVKYSKISIETAIISLIYVDRLIHEDQKFCLSIQNVYNNCFSCQIQRRFEIKQQ